MEIELKNVDFTYEKINYEKKEVLKNISMKFEAGKITSIIGKSGSGKTTLLELIDNIIVPTKGEIIIEDVNKIGFLFQFPEEQFFNQTVKKELEVILKLSDYKKDINNYNYNLHTNTYFSKQDKYILKFNIYKCLKGGKEISCPTDNNFTNIDKKEIQTTNNNYKLAIKYNTKEIYNGKLIENITKYITKTGDYNISITASTDNITSNIEFTTYIFN